MTGSRTDPLELAARIRSALPPMVGGSLVTVMSSDGNRVGAFLREITAAGAVDLPRFPADRWPQKVQTHGLAAGQAATIGTAFGWWLRLRLEADPTLTEATAASRVMPAQVQAALGDLELRLRDADAGYLEGYQRTERAAVVLAWCEQVWRSQGMALANSPLTRMPIGGTLADLMAMVPKEMIDQLQQLGWLAEERLMPAAQERGIRFGMMLGLERMGADADMMIGRSLLELKTVQGTERSAGGREFRFDPALARQLIGYALLDDHDRLGIETVGVYAARYGLLWEIELGRLIRVAGNVESDVPVLREAFRSLFDD